MGHWDQIGESNKAMRLSPKSPRTMAAAILGSALLWAVVILKIEVLPSYGVEPLPKPMVEAKEITAGGRLTGCSLQFVVAFPDHVYREGSPTGASGSINLWHRNGLLYTSFKLVGVDFGTDGGNSQRFKIENASLFNTAGKLLDAQRSQCSNPLDYCAALDSQAFLDAAAGIAERGTVRMAFNRSPGGLDVPLLVEANSETALSLLNCAQALVR